MNEHPATATLPRTVEAMLDAARRAAGLDDFGDEPFRDGLERYVAGLRDEAQLSALGEELAYGGVVNMLVNRLRYARDVRRHPEILAERITRPIIVLGLPRTGTTKLQRVLSACPQAQGMTYWRMLNPAPFPDEIPGHPEGRIQVAEALVDMLAKQFPGFMARHPTHARHADEEVLLMQGSFRCVVTWLFARSPSFYAHVMNDDARPLYRFLHGQMQYLQWQDGGARGRSWVLKSPCHTGLIDVLLETFPDAVLVNCHRDVRKVIPSIAGLVEEMRRIYSDRVDPRVIGPEMLDYFGRSMDRYLDIRAQLPADRILDVQYEDVLRDAVGVVGRVYERAGLELTPAAVQAIRAHEAELPQHQFGSYAYAAEQYGITDDEVAARFATYNARFIPPRSHTQG